MFLLADALLIGLDNVTDGLVVFPAMAKAQLDENLPYLATETIIMKLVGHGISRQEAHERIRVLSRETIHAVKVEGGKNDLIDRMKKDDFFVGLYPFNRLLLTASTSETHMARVRWPTRSQAVHRPVRRNCRALRGARWSGRGQVGKI